MCRIATVLLCMAAVVGMSCSGRRHTDATSESYRKILADTISKIASGYPGDIGVAVIINNADTVAVGERSVYPMMSVFKVHQALAICNDLDKKGVGLDTVIRIKREDLDPHTWSPMLKEHQESEIRMSVKDLLRYTLIQSDNNASNEMFRRLVGVEATDSFVAAMIPRATFRIAYTEEEMSADHSRAYSNFTSPLGAAILMNRLFTDSLISSEKQNFIKNTLEQCITGKDRIVAPLLGKEGVTVAHKTGSGYRTDAGLLAAHNDVAYITLPGGVRYTLAVFVKDFKGSEAEASRAIADISAAVYSVLRTR